MSTSYTPDSANSSSPSVPVIVVCATVGGAFALFLLVRVSVCVYRRRNLKSVPLPPIQPLAHYRESKWAPASLAPRDSTSGHCYSFHNFAPTSPLRTSSDPLCHPTRPFFYHDNSSQPTPTDDWRSSVFAPLSPIKQDPDYPLLPPHPLYATGGHFRGSDSSSGQASYSSDNDDSDGGVSPGPKSRQITPGPEGHEHSREHHRSQTAPPTLTQEMIAHRRLTRQARPQSIAQSISSVKTIDTSRSIRSMRSASTIRGAPHRPHSRVEIILPSPLAPSIYPSSAFVGQAPPLPGELAAAIAGFNMRDQRVMSVCDPWLPIGSTANPSPPSDDSVEMERRRGLRTNEAENENRSHSRLSRMSISSTSVGAIANSVRTSVIFRSSSSVHPASTPSRSTSPDPPQLPPVPAVPSVYKTPSEKGVPRPKNGSRAPSVERKSVERPKTPSSQRENRRVPTRQ